ncbi:hypothetical protein [Corynebacterium epidermidicanis]|uniref:Uncharacterized protein n=1 Tax=Corynebacterium epidermidicanis TaxID=1050174 RepID=A0A0G3GQX9_9CORY|nr:hypothetical protein [Corynebacterium epidermidicanis]AKK01973.1 hypothetical protein CEPID_00395 [Corynebacterium epidermidicanis]
MKEILPEHVVQSWLAVIPRVPAEVPLEIQGVAKHMEHPLTFAFHCDGSWPAVELAAQIPFLIGRENDDSATFALSDGRVVADPHYHFADDRLIDIFMMSISDLFSNGPVTFVMDFAQGWEFELTSLPGTFDTINEQDFLEPIQLGGIADSRMTPQVVDAFLALLADEEVSPQAKAAMMRGRLMLDFPPIPPEDLAFYLRHYLPFRFSASDSQVLTNTQINPQMMAVAHDVAEIVRYVADQPGARIKLLKSGSWPAGDIRKLTQTASFSEELLDVLDGQNPRSILHDPHFSQILNLAHLMMDSSDTYLELGSEAALCLAVDEVLLEQWVLYILCDEAQQLVEDPYNRPSPPQFAGIEFSEELQNILSGGLGLLEDSDDAEDFEDMFEAAMRNLDLPPEVEKELREQMFKGLSFDD